MSVINNVIPPQSFEIVRDRIGRILADELLHQFQLSGNPDLNVKNWIERWLQYDVKELPSVNVMLADGSYGGQTVIQSDGTYRYYIDCHVKAKSSENDPGDQKAMIKLHRLLGVCRSILSDARYKTLGFSTPPGFIMSRQVESIQISNPNHKEHDATSSVMGRLVFAVKVPETTEYVGPTTAREFVTSVMLSNTDKGYLWILANPGYARYFDLSYDRYFF